MKNFRKDAKIASVLIVAALLVSQAFRIQKSNPPVHSDISADPAVKSLMRRACYNCHSNETVWPWYSNVAPVSWLVANDVHEARRMMNFSEWGTYDRQKQSHKLTAIAEKMEDGSMPPWYYSMMHAESRLKPAERDQIRAWSLSAREPLSPSR